MSSMWPPAIYDLDNSVASREVVARFVHSGYFEITIYVSREEQVQELVDHGKVQAVIRLNKGFEENLKSGRKGIIQLIVDGTDSNTAAIVLNYSGKIVSRYSQDILIQRLVRLRGPGHPLSPVDLEIRAWFNENLESRNFYVPGVIALLVMLITLLLTSMAVVREKEIGTMEQIMVTPITPKEFILGKTLPFALISLVDVVLITLVGVFWFEVPIQGSLWLLLAGHQPLLDDYLGYGPLHFHGQPDPAAGHDECLLFSISGGAAFRIRLSHCQYAGSRPVAHLSESLALFSDHYPGNLSEGSGNEYSLAANGGPDGHGSADLVAGLEAVSKDPGLIREFTLFFEQEDL